MDRTATATIIDPAALDHDACEAFIDELYACHRLIFDGVDREAFARYVVRSPAEYTRIQVYRDGARMVGYAAIHFFDRELDGRPIVVGRGEVGMLRAYRRRTRWGWFFAREALAQMLRAPRRRFYGLSCATNPATYRSMTRSAPEVWPRWDRATPPAIEGLMASLSRQFSLEPVDPADPGVVHVGWQTRQTAHELRAWGETTHPAARYYLDRNPGYRIGHGMMMVIPMGIGNLLHAAGRLAVHQLRRAWRRRVSAVGQATHKALVEGSGVIALEGDSSMGTQS